ncbi:biotin--[acetyl-CoA-carboxylase] ligase [Flavobacterium salilacus subsp. salilacus]|uniref:biotin--[acetyl-CoA-carboxylase] ligase n=1 Tax=Flavobacterium TaxID=237 RepID=UPI0010755CD4|nr:MULTISPECIES: biotin--[acetyl-CoA-carboxylase] ligase [Flavobacterium]KAF2519082.1 biotin--[acetyl-CoA-carboxylase] ligase [Flavobacterium salilacus subsp. salilacus]MBE1613259.1 biotin--[acetyl-CoA-carboxylase] ligase [Flavobacterium sp. SaA2.13]
MNIIKLSAIHSTNDYLKELSAMRHVDNFTIAIAEHQTQGKGQMGTRWEAEHGKNLTFSVLVKDLLLEINAIFYLNAAVAVSIVETLEKFNMPGLAIKWPNDILAGNKKLGGILIENNIRSNGEIHSVVGIGINVNQTEFEGLPKATSLALIAAKEFDKNDVMIAVAENLKRNLSLLLHKDTDAIWDKYLLKLYKKNVPMTFEREGMRFMGIIKGVSKSGSLEVQLEDDSIAHYKVKEVQLLY